MRGFQYIILSMGLSVGGFVHSVAGGVEKPAIRFTKSSQNFGIPNLNATDVSLGDLDGDGDVDAFEVNQAGTARVFLNQGDGHFVDSGQLLGAKNAWGDYDAPVWRCDLGDVDGDGDLDALAGEWLWLNDGRGLFSLHSQKLKSAPWEQWSGDHLAAPDSQFVDFDGDGDLDIWSGRLWRNDGNHVFVGVESVLDELPAARIAFGDFDEDGNVEALRNWGAVELVHLWGEDERVDRELFPPHGDPSQWGGGGKRHMIPYDLNGDGHLDFAAAGGASGFTALGDGAGRFGQPSPSGLGGGQGFAFGDLNGEYVSVIFGFGGLCEYGYGSGIGGDCLDCFRGPDDPELADLDGDGDLDLWLIDGGVGYIVLNMGGDSFIPAESLQLVPSLRDLALGDLDADGDLDAWLVWGGLGGSDYFGYPDRFLLNDGSGTFTWSILEDDHNTGASVALVDLDKDSDIDAYVTTEHFGGLSELEAVPDVLWMNSGVGVFSSSEEDPLPRSIGSAVAAGDVDNDGFSDLCVSTPGGWMAAAGSRILLNDGSGVLSESAAIAEGAGDVALDDLDGDGDLDMVLVDHVWRNDGTGVFSMIRTGSDGGVADDLPLRDEDGQRFPVRFDLADLDGDGDIDIMWVSYSETWVSLNHGDATFDSRQIDAPVPGGADLALGDLDGDGVLDAWVATNFQGSFIYINDGNAGLTPVVVANAGDPARRVSLGDLDGDGDLDAMLMGHQSVSVWLNGEEPRIDSVEVVNGFLRIEYEGSLHGAGELGLDGFLPIDGASSPFMVPLGPVSRFFVPR